MSINNKVIVLYKNGQNISRISKKLNIERKEVIGILNKSGFKVETKKAWTDEDIETLCELSKEMPPEDISLEMDRSIKSITAKMTLLGLHSVRAWSQEDEDYLADYWGFMQVEALAAKLGRTPAAIRKRAKEMNLLSARDDAGFLKLSDIEKITGISVYNLKKFGENGLKIKTNYITKKTKYNYIDMEDLLDFLYKNQDAFDASKFEMVYFYNVPEWLLEKRKQDINKKTIKKHERWTDYEKNVVKTLFKMGKDISEIAEKMNRTESSIKNICYN